MNDQKKREILELLEKDARLSAAQIAVLLREPEDAVAKAMAAFEQSRTILQYRALVDWKKAGEKRIRALIDVKVTPERDTGFNRVAERIARFPEVKSCYLMSGNYDLSVVVEAADSEAVGQFIAERLSTIDGIVGTATHFIFKRYKHDGVLFGGEEIDERLAVTP
jgi:DNA-binding Lrp family transcriptional regulator